jgi:hypothetical protein
MPNPQAGGLGAARIARQQHDTGPLVRKNLGDRFPNTHGRACDHDNFPLHLHGDSCNAWSAVESNAGVKSPQEKL